MEEASQSNLNPGLCREDFLGLDGVLNLSQVFLCIVAGLKEVFPDLVVEASLQARITPDYEQAMVDLSREIGMELVPTKSREALGLAMTVDAGSYDIIVLDSAIIEALFTAAQMDMIHVIHHELGHAHDHAIRREGWAQDMQNEHFSRLRQRMFPLAERLWSEYHAERRSAGTIRGKSLTAPLLLDVMVHLVEEVSSLISAYRFHANISRLLEEITTKVAFLLQVAGYVLGDLAGTTSEPAQLHPELPAAMMKPPLADLWQPLLDALDRLYLEHGRWESSAVFNQLEALLVQVFHCLGLDFSERPEGLWVDVPHTPLGREG